MLTRSQVFQFFFACVVAQMLTGCAKSDRPATAQASGIVKLDGVPVAGASVMFQPVAGGRPGTGITDENGIYQISSYGQPNDGAAVGEHRVSVVKISGEGASSLAKAADASGADPKPAASSDPNALSEMPLISDDEAEVEPSSIEYLVPKKYEDPNASGLTLTVPESGSSTLDLQLTSD